MTKAIGSYITAINEQPIFTINEAISKFVGMSDNNFSFSIILAAPRKLPAADRDREFIELDLTAPSFTVPSPDYDADDDDDVEHIASLSIEDIRHLTSLRTQLSAEEIASVSTKGINLAIHAMKSNDTTPVEKALGRFTR